MSTKGNWGSSQEKASTTTTGSGHRLRSQLFRKQPSMSSTADVVVIGAGPAGVMAAAHAAELGAPTVLVTQQSFGGMAANDGPVPVRTLAHTAHLMRNARQLGQYGVVINEPELDYQRLLERV